MFISVYILCLSGIISRVSSSLDPDHARRFVRPDLGPNCLQRLSSNDTNNITTIKQIRELPRKSELGINIKLKEHQIFAC